MKVTQDGTEARQTSLTIEVEPQELEEYLNRAYRRTVQRITIPGFRKGKVPRRILEQYVGREALLDDAMDDLIPEVTAKAVQQESLEMGDLPRVEVAQRDPVVLKATVPLTPLVDLGEYRSLRLEEEPAEVTDEQVQQVLEQLRHDLAPWEPVDRPVRLDDLVVFDLHGTADGRTVADQQNVSYIAREGAANPLPGFAAQLMGMAKGESKEFTLTFPQDYPDAPLAGKEGQFTASVSEIKGRQLPELDDEFAKSAGEGYDTLEALREKVRQNLQAEAQRVARRRLEEAMANTLLQQARVEIPPLVVEHQLAHLLEEQQRDLQRRGGDMDAYLERLGKTPEQLREELREEAEARLKRSLVLDKVAELEHIVVTPEDVDQEVATLSSQSGQQGEALRGLFGGDRGRDSLARLLRTRRTMECLVEIARGEAPPLSPAEEEEGSRESTSDPEGKPAEEESEDDPTP